jgi:hypothetical protein
MLESRSTSSTPAMQGGPALPTGVRFPSPRRKPSAGAPGPRTGVAEDSVDWQRKYSRAVMAMDVALIAVSVLAGTTMGAGLQEGASLTARALSGALAGILLVTSLTLNRAWDPRFLGAGSVELSRVLRAFCVSSTLVGLIGLALGVESLRLWVFLVFPICGLLCLCGHYAARKVVHRKRTEGRFLLPVLAVGNEQAVADLIRRTRRDKYFGWIVTGACTPTGTGRGGSGYIEGVPVVGDLDAVVGPARAGGYRVLAITPTSGWSPRRLHALAWELEGSPIELAVDPGLMEFAGPRLHIAPVDGFPLIRLSQPRFTGGGWLVKSVVDRVAACLLLLLISPIFAVIALAVGRDGGPVLYRQERVGAGGKPFRMVKFRSMKVGADTETDALLPANEAFGPMFKIRHDPRVTPVGAVLRRYSLDELPQLFNVIAGTMSLVGPRPPLLREVRPRGSSPAPGAAGHDRAVAGERTQRPVLGGDDPARPALRRGLVDRARRDDPLEDHRCRAEQPRSVLTASARRSAISAGHPTRCRPTGRPRRRSPEASGAPPPSGRRRTAARHQVGRRRARRATAPESSCRGSGNPA